MRKLPIDRVSLAVPEFTTEDLENLRIIAQRRLGLPADRHVLGPEYERLLRQGLICRMAPDSQHGMRIQITAAGLTPPSCLT